MSDDNDLNGLLGLCLWDLGEGTLLLCERLPQIIEDVDASPLKKELQGTIEAAAERSARYFKLTDQTHGPPNLWMTGILADARRDSQTIQRGVSLDIALIGAVRKMLQAERASIETALVLARGCHDAREHDVARLKEQCGQNDRTLKEFLNRFARREDEFKSAGSRQVVGGGNNAW
ncbi:MAG: hypothetical protein JKY75_01850 [Erythrobacter sp.]|jgi:hypothetical protein|nr:hypothetical protein [Erythrobacter sp.]